MRIWIDTSLKSADIEARIANLLPDTDVQVAMFAWRDRPLSRGEMLLWFLPADQIARAKIYSDDPVIVIPVCHGNGRVPMSAVQGYTTECWHSDGGRTEHRVILRRAMKMLSDRYDHVCAQRTIALKQAHLYALYDVGAKLSSEPHLESLLELIVTTGREITHADAGSLYLVEEDEDATSQLAFLVAQNDSLSVPFKAFRMPISDASIAGFVANSGKTVRHEDVYELGDNVPYNFNKSFDASVGYRTKSMMVVPLRSHEGYTIGVLQLINKRAPQVRKFDKKHPADKYAITFTREDIEMCQALGSQAAIAVENARLYGEIQNLLESFMRASVKAIEARDPTTSGHSERVAEYTVELGKTIDNIRGGRLGSVAFSRKELDQIYFAGILHDFGKIGVREDVLVKAKKLYPGQRQAIEDRFAYARRTAELRIANQTIEHLRSNDPAQEEKILSLRDTGRDQIIQLDRAYKTILESNEPSLLHQDEAKMLQDVLGMSFLDLDGTPIRLLHDDEYANLSIGRGSLNESEREEIESHVKHTFAFLQMIPWTRDLSDVPNIAYGHHEKLDGSGYPRQLTAPEIAMPVRMMTVADIFDALTAQDRPYKKAVPVDRALNILSMEVEEGKLDADVVKVFVEAKVYECVLGNTGN